MRATSTLCVAAVRRSNNLEAQTRRSIVAAELRRKAEKLERENPFSLEAENLYAEAARLERR